LKYSDKPYILDETEDYAVIFKPPRMHCAPLKNNSGNTLLDWYAAFFPPVMDLSGRKKGEGGLLHRLDFETQGLVLLAKNQKTLDFLLTQQDEGNFIKEYNAITQKAAPPHSSFPHSPIPPFPSCIESYFRPFGPGRKQVRPVTDTVGKGKEVVTDKGARYRTEIISVSEIGQDHLAFTLRLRRGFRHQIRCHLAWIGCPVLNDPLYGTYANDEFLALRATRLVFADPKNGSREPVVWQEYRIDS